MFRSAPMSLCNMYLQPEAAYETMSQLGEMCCVQFIDINEDVPPFQRAYVTEMCRCAELERKLRYIEGEIIKDQIYIHPMRKEPPAMDTGAIVPFEAKLEKWEGDIEVLASNQVKLNIDYADLSEMYYILTHISKIVGETEALRERNLFSTGELGEAGHLYITTGVIARTRCYAFETMIWRISHGNIYYKIANEDKLLLDHYGNSVRKVAFIVICQGESLSSKIEKVCTGFRANVYPWPRSYSERISLTEKLENRLMDMDQVLKKTKFHRCKTLSMAAKDYKGWLASVKKTKAIYHHLNLFSLDYTKKCLIGECWIPTDDRPKIRNVLIKCSENAGSRVESFISTKQIDVIEDHPPTFYRTNKFTVGFQNLINAYGDAVYGELNPGLYTVITFPFLFAMMFGDLGHAMIMAMFATWMIRNEKKFLAEKSTNEIWNIFFSGRYVILLMGLFSIYTGFVYNDIFSKAMAISSPTWKNKYSNEEISTSTAKYLSLGGGRVKLPPKAPDGPAPAPPEPAPVEPVPPGPEPVPPEERRRFGPNIKFGKNNSTRKKDIDRHVFVQEDPAPPGDDEKEDSPQPKVPEKKKLVTYLIGVDPAWNISKNKIVFENSLKMKLSIIIGVVHMTFGIMLSFFNHTHFKHKHAIFLEFLPQVIFLTSLFMYLVFMMYFKWLTFSMYSDDPKRREGCAPLLLIYFIDMVLMSTTKPVADGCDAYMYPGQQTIQTSLVFIGLSCIPIMLFGSPCYLNSKFKKKRSQYMTHVHTVGAGGGTIRRGFRSYMDNKMKTTANVAEKQETEEEKKGFRSYKTHHDGDSEEKQRADALKKEEEETKKEEERERKKEEEIMKRYPNFGELMITQGVHTIEFVLSTVSHTASYLRLWALSLAHAQLSEMLWAMILGKIALSDHSAVLGPIKIFVIFAVWASFTISIMVLMEGLSAFLHTLRLHWVEFMSKFFIGCGNGFVPFCFRKIVDSDEVDNTMSVCVKRLKAAA